MPTQYSHTLLILSIPGSKSTFSQPFEENCISEVVRIGRIFISHLSKLWKVRVFILCDVIFLLRLQEKFEIDHSGSGRVHADTVKPHIVNPYQMALSGVTDCVMSSQSSVHVWPQFESCHTTISLCLREDFSQVVVDAFLKSGLKLSIRFIDAGLSCLKLQTETVKWVHYILWFLSRATVLSITFPKMTGENNKCIQCNNGRLHYFKTGVPIMSHCKMTNWTHLAYM